jgi:hypothetical protein
MRKAIPPISAHAADLKQRLQREHDHHKKLRLQRLYALGRTRFRAKLKVPRPSHTKKP